VTLRVFVIDHSATARQVHTRVLEADASIQVCRACANAFDAFAALAEDLPDVILLGLEMPRLDGVGFLKKLLSQFSVPVVVCSSTIGTTGDVSAEALAAGASSVVPKPLAYQGDDGAHARALRSAVLQAAPRRAPLALAAKPAAAIDRHPRPSSLIVLGASTGGTEAIATLLRGLRGTIPPIVIVQHMPPEYTRRFADRLNRLTSLEVSEATDGQLLRNNMVLVAAGGRHVDLEGSRDTLRVVVRDGVANSHHTPSVDELFHAAARLRDVDIAGVLLTGMGADGADGMTALFRTGATTIAQDEASCAVFGMPREAILRGAAQRVLALANIPNALMLWSARSVRAIAS
jgi:two-component system chemotaxis response regulator CheB